MGFLNKNAVAARQLPVLAHQRIFAVSADLHGIMDTAQIGGYRITPAVSPRLPIGKRLSWAVVSPQLKMGGYRITPAVSLRLPIGKRLSWAVVSPQLKMGRPASQYAGLNPLFFQERLQALGFHHF